MWLFSATENRRGVETEVSEYYSLKSIYVANLNTSRVLTFSCSSYSRRFNMESRSEAIYMHPTGMKERNTLI
jgi:hypothetical protein